MPHSSQSQSTRRGFLGAAAEFAGAFALGGAVRPATETGKALPQRRLGRTEAQVSVLGLGLGPVGLAKYPPAEFEEVVQAALDEGITYFDVQPDYGNAEAYLASWLGKHRARVFLVTKTWGKSAKAALDSVKQSVRRLNVEYVDAVLLNNLGDYDVERLFAADGAFAGLDEARRRRLTRFLGISGHMRAERSAQALETGRFDIVMPVINFVDRHTYKMEEKVLPVAARHDVGVAAMKVLGGAVGWNYSTRAQRALLPPQEHRAAIRYALGLPGVSVAVIGCKSPEEIRLASAVARDCRPLDRQEWEVLLKRGRELAPEWGPRFGPA